MLSARYVVLKDGRAAFFLITWTLATWCSRTFGVHGSFNASPVTAHPTEAQLYRAAARTSGV